MPDQQEIRTGLKVIAYFKFGKAILLLGIALGLFACINPNLFRFLNRLLVHLKMHSETLFIHQLQDRYLWLTPANLHYIAAGSLLYSIFLFIEGIGLWFQKRWGEYLVLLSTGCFIPFEVYIVVEQHHLKHFLLLLINICILVYVASVVLKKRDTSPKP